VTEEPEEAFEVVSPPHQGKVSGQGAATVVL
jgi:hypothetical protein